MNIDSSFEKKLFSVLADDYVNKELAPLSHLIEKDAAWILQVDLPMVSKKDIHITLAPNRLVITAKLEKAYCLSKMNCSMEFNYFKKVISLPTDIDKKRISAKFEHGILTISMPKTVKGITIPVN